MAGISEQNEGLRNPCELQLIVCDNDGCLLPEEPSLIAFETLAPITAYNRLAAASAGSALVIPPLTIATGRPGPFVELLLRLLACPTVPAVCEHGVLTYSLAENHARRDPTITVEQLAMIAELRNWLRTEHGDWILEAGKEATVSVYVPEGGALVDERLAVIAAKVAAEGWPLVVARSVTYVNATLAEVTKATGLAVLFAKLEVDPGRVLAIGDTAGDLTMREVCGFFACPANAVAEVRERSDYVSPKPLTAGVVDILHHYTGYVPEDYLPQRMS